jgi:cytochrome P450
LYINTVPSIIARKGNRGREKLFAAFRKYYAANGHLNASPLVKGRFHVNSSHGLSLEDIAHFDVVNSFALIVNSVPTTFWCIYHLFTRPALLDELRTGIKSHSQKSADEMGTMVNTVDIHALFTELPLLSGIVKEVLRVLSTNASVRILSEDAIVDNKYKLKKDSLVFLPAPDLHHNTSIYGYDAAEFKPERWSGEGAKFPAASFRAFGGGSSLCPGRHLSMNEIMVVLVAMAMKYDVQPAADNGQWKEVKTKLYVNISLWAPAEDIEVQVSERRGLANEQWKFLWKGEKLNM